MSLSIVIPICNECESIRPLYVALTAVLNGSGRNYEILFVDDGSNDGSYDELLALAERDRDIKLIRFARNFGQTAALAAGIEYASGEVIVTLDGDRQNDPADIPLLLAKLDAGFDLVHGWRKDRHDAFHRTLPSRIANWLIRRVTGVPLHDLGCTLKAMRREIARALPLIGDMHRFIPILAHANGARCAQVIVRHHPRRAGKTKYGLGRTFRVLRDLIAVQRMIRRGSRPLPFERQYEIRELVNFGRETASVNFLISDLKSQIANPPHEVEGYSIPDQKSFATTPE